MKKRGFSLLPRTVTVESAYSGTLELNSWMGTTTLDSANANYSYGSLQKVLRTGIEITGLEYVNTILVLGMGGGSVIQTLRNEFNYQGNITAVEIDPEVIRIAEEVFNIASDAHLKIHCADASQFVKECTETYDLIIVDLFIDDMVPEVFTQLPFWQSVSKWLSDSGKFIFNVSIHEKDAENIFRLRSNLDSLFETALYQKIQNTNTLIIGQKRKL